MIKRTALLFAFAVAGFAQIDWKTSATVPGVDLSGLNGAQKRVALEALRSETCNCGCNYKVAECRTVDPQCAFSRRFGDLIVKMAAAGKTGKDIHEAIVKMASEPPPLLSDPVKISIDGDPIRGPVNAKITIVEFSDFQ
jgi:hypothetical protein